MHKVDPVPCQHIADYYEHKWATQPNLGHNLLARGYREYSIGLIQGYWNNLYRPIISLVKS